MYFVFTVSAALVISSCTSPQRVYSYAPNYAPSHLIVDVPKIGYVGIPSMITVSAIDDSSNGLTYELDLNGNGSVVHTAESYIPGSSVHISNSWEKPGEYFIRVRAVDSLGAKSPIKVAKIIILPASKYNSLHIR